VQAACEAGGPDRFRLITRVGGAEEFQALDVIGNPAGGALMLHRRVGAADLAHDAPSKSWRKREQHLILSPREFSAMMYWLDRLGVLSPGAGTSASSDHDLAWLISGCLDGSWFQNAYQPGGSDDGTGLDIRLDRLAVPPSSGGGIRAPVSDPVQAPLPPAAGNRPGLSSAAPVATPTANRAGLGTGR